MTIDNLLAVEVVTADGEIVVASADSQPDLFWALRGGGGNFGVATRFQFRLQELGDNNPHLRTRPLAGREGEARMKLFAASCSLGEYRIADVDGVLLDVAEADSR